MPDIAPDSAETERLLVGVGAGDAKAFDRLFARHRAYLRRFVALRIDPKLRPRVDPSDVVQDTQLDAFRRMDDYLRRKPMPFRLWLRRTAQERLIMLRREHVQADRRSVERSVSLPDRSSLLLAQQLLDPRPGARQQLERQELIGRVRQAIAGLAELDREILLMRNLEGLSNDEAACLLGIEPAAARKRHGRALLRLRKLLVRGGLEQ